MAPSTESRINPFRKANSPFALAVCGRAWSAAAGLATLHFVTAYLVPVGQGYYFAFNSLAQFTQFVDLGLQVLIVQFASHEAARLTFGPRGKVNGDPDAVSRLSSLGRFGVVYYSIGALILCPVLVTAGYWMFGSERQTINWELPWLVLSFLVTIDLILSSFVWLLEGTNQLVFVYGYRLIRGIFSAVTIWLVLRGGGQLWAIPISLLVVIAITIVFLVCGRPQFMLLFLRRPQGAAISWRYEIMPLQWRLAISTVAGFATYSLFVPVTFKFAGPVAAGQFGLTWSLVDNMSVAALLALYVKFPSMGSLAAKRDWIGLDGLTLRASSLSLALTLVGVAILLVVAWYLHAFMPQLGARLLGTAPLIVLALSAVLKTVQVSLVLYLRAHRQEPIVPLTSVAAPLTAGAVIVGAWLYGATGVVVAYFLVMLVVWLPYTTWLTLRLRAAWHAPAAADGLTE
jgi:hypothetical protein